MTRDQKIAMLEAISNGASLKDVLPAINLCLIEAEPGLFTECNQRRIVPGDRLETYIQQVKQANPRHIIKLTIIGNTEFNRISQQLEAEY